MRHPATAFIGIGANLGDPRAQVEAAIGACRALSEGAFDASSLWRSAPWQADGDDYVNAVVRLRTRLSPQALLRAMQAIETRFGRERPFRNAPRTLDLDLLLYGERRLRSGTLTLPHPRLGERAFVLRPLAELAPRLVVPGQGPLARLLQAVGGQRIDKLPR